MECKRSSVEGWNLAGKKMRNVACICSLSDFTLSTPLPLGGENYFIGVVFDSLFSFSTILGFLFFSGRRGPFLSRRSERDLRPLKKPLFIFVTSENWILQLTAVERILSIFSSFCKNHVSTLLLD
jgi:hypothetical protein